MSNSVTIGVADERIGLVLGRGGRNVLEISQVQQLFSFGYSSALMVISFSFLYRLVGPR